MATNAQYQIFRENVMDLARSMVIKVDGVAQTINRELKLLGYEIDEDPMTWKYYMNMNGEYHETDRLMTVRSVDTLSTIPFTKDALDVNRATLREYQNNKRFREVLERRFPNQTSLIRGIIKPIDKEKAIEAEDGTILSMTSDLIQDNEYTFLEEVQNRVYRFFARWYNEQYRILDDLYMPAFMGLLHLQIPNFIFLTRFRAARTAQAHQFFVREFLRSRGGLDIFISQLNRTQQLYLYRNLDYLRQYVGHQSTFNQLIDVLLTERSIPLKHYSLEHDTSQMPESLYPKVKMVSRPLNFIADVTVGDEVDVHTILEKERAAARDNAIVESEAEDEIIFDSQRDLYNELSTKVLESDMIDRTNSSVRPFEDVLINEWLYLSTHDRYSTVISVLNPGTGNYMNMSAKEAFIVAWYAFHKARNVTFDTIPVVFAYQVTRHPLPDMTELKSYGATPYINDEILTWIIDNAYPMGTYVSAERFYLDCVESHKTYLKFWQMYSLRERILTRAFLEQITKAHYMNVKCPLVDGIVNYDEWLINNGFDITDLTPANLDELATSCVEQATGMDLFDQSSLFEVQRAMIGLMRTLSSYSVQYLKTINEDHFWYAGIPGLRIGDIETDLNGYMKLSVSHLYVRRLSTSIDLHIGVPKKSAMPYVDIDAEIQTDLMVETTPPIRIGQMNMGHVYLDMHNFNLNSVAFNVEYDDPENTTL